MAQARRFHWAIGYAIGATCVAAGVMLACRPVSVACFTQFDGHHYEEIATLGYSYQDDRPSNVAFFPAYPLLASLCAWVTGARTAAVLVVIANVALLAAAGLFSVYASERPRVDPGRAQKADTISVLLFSLAPCTFFFRMAYSESLFVLCLLIFLLAILRKYPAAVVAFIAGAVTAIRPVGVALLPAVWIVIASDSSASNARKLARVAVLTPLALWGLLAYMAWLQISFGHAFAFSQTQQFWRLRPDYGSLDKALGLLSWEPIWRVYDPSSSGSWRRFGSVPFQLFNLQFANPIYFFGTALLVAIGAFKGWLSRCEIVVSAALLLIPYLTRSYEMCMASHGRFAAVVVPAYFVGGEILSRAPIWCTVLVLLCSAVMLVGYAACFSLGYQLI